VPNYVLLETVSNLLSHIVDHAFLKMCWIHTRVRSVQYDMLHMYEIQENYEQIVLLRRVTLASITQDRADEVDKLLYLGRAGRC
jgi:mRNA-degrading endonuclease YafQ of YafQ-DinJ toxin-antitoxin module